MPHSILKNNNRIARQLMLYVVLASAVITLSTTAYQLYEDYSRQRQSLEARIDQISQVHIRNLTTHVWVADYANVKNYLRDILSLPDMRYLEISESDGNVIKVGEKQTSNHIARSFPLLHDYQGRKMQIGVLHVQASLEDIYQRLLRQSGYMLSSNALAIFLLAGFVLFLFNRLATRHLQALADHAAVLNIDNLSTQPRLDKTTRAGVPDEVDVLVEAFSRMQSSLQASIHALTESEAQTRLILDSAAEAIYGQDRDGLCTFVNPACLSMLGYAHAEDLIGKEMHSLIHHSYADGAHPPKRECLFFTAAASGEVGHSEEDMFWRADGSSFPVEWWSHPIYRGGELLGAVVTFLDISQRLETQEALRKLSKLEIDARLAAVVDTAVDGIITISEEGVVETFNNAAVTLFGYTVAEVVGRNIRMLMPSHYAAEHDAYLANYRHTGKARIIGVGREVTGQRKDGSTFPMELSVTQVDLGERRIFTGIVRDITERHTAQAALRQFKETLDQTLDCVFMFGAEDLRFFYVNSGAATQVGYTRDELMRMTPVDIKPQFDEHEFRALLTPLLNGDEHARTFETVHRHRDGHDIPVEISLQYIPREDERGHFIAIVRDATDRHQIQAALLSAKAEAEQANRAKSAFLAAMSHEIRTPMNGVIGMVDVLAYSSLDEDQVDAVRTIRESAFSLLGLIDDILDFSKIEAGRLDLERAPVSLTDIVEGVCNTLAPMGVNKGVEVYLFVAPAVPEQIWSDSVRLRQILYNLVGNAIKFCGEEPGGGRVEVRVGVARDEPLTLQFSVADNGIGMTAETMANLFTSFSQAETSTTRRFGGTGLGLAISGRLVELMQGRIAVQSTFGAGSTFRVTLPAEAVAGGEPCIFPDLAGLQCILVNSKYLNGDDIRAYLERAGARVSEAADLTEAAQMARTPTGAVVVHSTRNVEVSKDALQAAFQSAPGARHLLITGGRCRRPRIDAANVVTLDGDILRRQSFLRAVAVAAGRASPEIVYRDAGAHEMAGENLSPSVAEARAQGRLILVAEDDAINRKVILKQLAMLGYAGEVADDGAEAIQLWRDGNYALLLTDLHMPVMDGYELAEAIRREEAEGCRMPVLALTANALRGEESRAEQAGMDEYLTKPVELDRLAEALDRWLPGVTPTVAPSSPEPSTEALQIDVLKALVGDDPETLEDFFRDYLHLARQLSQSLSAALLANDMRSFCSTVHKLKSSSRSVGALTLGDLCAELENACTTTDADAITELMPQFERTLAAVEAGVIDYLDRQLSVGTVQ